MNNEQRIQQLEKQVKDLLAWKESKTRQQLSYPLDQASRDILSKDTFIWTGVFAEDGVNYTGAICKINGLSVAVQVANPNIYT